MDWLKDLADRWAKSVSVFLDPLAVIGYVAMALLLVASLGQGASVDQARQLTIAIVTIILSVVSGLVGAVLQDRWNRQNQKELLKAKGSGAVRSLKNHLNAVMSLEERAGEFLRRCPKSQPGSADAALLFEAYFEEIIRDCGLLQENVGASIEDWTDIVPEAAVKTDLRSMRKLRQEWDQLAGERVVLRNELAKLAESRDASEQQLKDIQAQIDEKTAEQRRIQKELDAKRLSTGIGGSSIGPFLSWDGTRITLGQGLIDSQYGIKPDAGLKATLEKQVTCKQCGAAFVAPLFPTGETKCPECGKPQ